jgi:hypothetical protein
MANSFVTNLYPIPSGTANDHRLTVDATAGGVQFSQSGKDVNTNAFDSLTKYIAFDVQEADVYMTFDGSAPVATSGSENGHKLFAGRSYTFSKEAAVKAKFIRSGGTSAKIHASQFTN